MRLSGVFSASSPIRILGFGLVALLMALIAGCASTASQVAVPYAVELTASKDVNPDSRGRPSPIQITLFELRSSNQFEGSDFFTLQGDAQAALGKELLDTEQIILKPGESRTIRRPGNVDARVIGVVAGYRNLENSNWRLVVTLPEPKQTNIYKVWQLSPSEEPVPISIDKQGMQVTEAESGWWLW